MKRRTWWMLAASIALLALAASATGLPNQFAYDDVYVIQKEPSVHTLAHWWHLFAHTYWPPQWGSDGYRPLTIIGFAVQWVVGHGSPLLYHSVNVALYMAMCVAVYWVMTAVLPSVPAWIAAALFAVHPVHVEAVANIVGQSELTVGLLLTVAMGLYIHGRQFGPLSPWRQVAICAIYAAAMLFKEHGITLIALVVLAEVTAVRDSRPLRARLVEMRPMLLAMFALALAFLWARSKVIKGTFTGFQPYVAFQGLQLSAFDRILTMVGLSPNWVRLMLWPAHLVTEYAPPMAPLAQGPSFTQIPGALLIVGTIGIFFATIKKAPATALGLGWVMIAISPVSNLVVPAGFLIAERTLLFPSVGAMIVVGSVIPYVYNYLEARRAQWALPLAVTLLLAAGIWRSAKRQKIWHDDDSLFKQAVIDAPDSYRSHFMLGAWYMQNKHMKLGEQEYREAVRLFPYDPYMAFAFAENYRGWGICKPAVDLYRWAIALDTATGIGRPQLANCLLLENQYKAAKKAAVTAVAHGAPVQDMHNILVWADSDMQHLRPPEGIIITRSGESPDSVQKAPGDSVAKGGKGSAKH